MGGLWQGFTHIHRVFGAFPRNGPKKLSQVAQLEEALKENPGVPLALPEELGGVRIIPWIVVVLRCFVRLLIPNMVVPQ